jgi:hypothetical protein
MQRSKQPQKNEIYFSRERLKTGMCSPLFSLPD